MPTRVTSATELAPNGPWSFPNRPRIDPIRSPDRPGMDPRPIRNGAQTDPEWSPDRSGMEPRPIRNGPQADPEWTPDRPELEPRPIRVGPQTDPEWTPNGARNESQTNPARTLGLTKVVRNTSNGVSKKNSKQVDFVGPVIIIKAFEKTFKNIKKNNRKHPYMPRTYTKSEKMWQKSEIVSHSHRAADLCYNPCRSHCGRRSSA